MTEKDFYILSEKHSNYAKAFSNEGEAFLKQVKKCPMCGAITYPDTKHTIFLKGKREADFYFAIFCRVVSPRFLHVLWAHEISGFSEKEVKCTGWFDGKGKRLERDTSGYRELIITGRAGYLKNKEGVELPKCPKCGAILKMLKKTKELLQKGGFAVDEEWDGSDLFYFKNWLGVIIVTERVKKALEDNKIKNIVFTRLDEKKMC